MRSLTCPVLKLEEQEFEVWLVSDPWLLTCSCHLSSPSVSCESPSVHEVPLSSLKISFTWRLLQPAFIKSSLCARQHKSPTCFIISHPVDLHMSHCRALYLAIWFPRHVQVKQPSWCGWRGPRSLSKKHGELSHLYSWPVSLPGFCCASSSSSAL